MMPSGGARSRSGPAPDPDALRRLRPADEKTWIELDPAGYHGEVPKYPFTASEFAHPSEAENAEAEMWARLWRKPQAAMWARLDLADQVAMYVRTYLEASKPGAATNLRNTARQMESDLGVSIDGMLRLRWRFRGDDLESRRESRPEGTASKGSSAKNRLLKAVGDG